MNSPMRSRVALARMLAAALLIVGLAAPASATAILTENFDDVGALAGNGWTLINNSTPVGDTSWFQGNPDVFTAFSGAPDSYIAANFLGAGFGGSISEYLISPLLTLNNGYTISFYTRSAGPADGVTGDQLQVLFSQGAGTDVSTFTTSLLSVTDYPGDWTQYVITVSGLAGATQGRFALRYVVDDTTVNGDYIGVDNVAVLTPEPSTLSLLGIGAVALVRKLRGRGRRQA
jgi:hypothetical protein